MSEFLIRPHHMLCLQFFEGKGYSDGFVENMIRVKKELDENNPMVNIVHGTDDICASCPKNMGGRCENEASVIKHDERVYSQVKEYVGEQADWEGITKTIYKNIIRSGKVKQVCGECSWSSICFQKSKISCDDSDI